MAIYRQDIVKYITDRPGQVVYRSDVATDLDLEESQVSAVVRQFKASSPIGNEVEVVVSGHAWRYVPHRVADGVPTTERAPNPGLPMTSLIRAYMMNNAYRIVSVDDMVAYTGRTERQVQAALNNIRNIVSHGDFTRYLQVIVPGQLWRYDPPERNDARTVPSTARRPVGGPTRTDRTSVTSTATVAPTTTVDGDGDGDDDGQTFRLVGTSGDAVIIEDENGVLYRAVPVR